MDENGKAKVNPHVYYIEIPMEDNPPRYRVVARALTPECAADVVRCLVGNPAPDISHVRVAIGREL